ncbi:MAG: xanthine dehydrogenase molybdopterin binding subunit, partial [Comamonadaceae bacterium]|nr:xanthine dehydrogenase molybdopterin binding subunit [Comamonadaceae bacterium]
MNKPVPSEVLNQLAAFAPYQDNQRLRLDPGAEARAHAAGARVGISQAHESAALHVTGSATYTDDIPELAGTLHCALGLSPVAAGRLLGMDLAALRAMPGVVRVFTAADIPGANDWGSIVHDDPILCDGEIRYLGQPVFAVVAETRAQALRAAALAKKLVRVEAAPPVLTPQEAHARGQYVVPPMHLVRSDSGLDEAGIHARIASA